jgi:hypothetical protein
MAKRKTMLPTVQVESFIVTVRGQKVILDSDLAALYGVTTKRLNEQVRRNAGRFPDDFVFRLTAGEVAAMRSQSATASGEEANLRSQFATSRSEDVTSPEVTNLRSQIVISSLHGGRRHQPHAFTEQGAIMAANVLNSPQAVRMSVFVVRAFVKMREALGQSRALAEKLAELERKLTERLDVHEQAIVLILAEIQNLMTPPPASDRPTTQIGFRTGESEAPYRRRPRRTWA